jgi:transcriptional regulator with XRE-family HTH domain
VKGGPVHLLNLPLARRRRKEMGLSLAELGGLVGVDASTLHRWETGEFEPRSIDKVREWAQVLGVEFSELATPPKGWQAEEVGSKATGP